MGYFVVHDSLDVSDSSPKDVRSPSMLLLRGRSLRVKDDLFAFLACGGK